MVNLEADTFDHGCPKLLVRSANSSTIRNAKP